MIYYKTTTPDTNKQETTFTSVSGILFTMTPCSYGYKVTADCTNATINESQLINQLDAINGVVVLTLNEYNAL